MRTLSTVQLVPFALVLMLASPAGATLFVRLADGDLADQADLIAEVRVLSIDRAAGSERARTEIEVDVEDLIAGRPAGSRLTLALAGGVLADGTEVRLFGTPSFEAGQRALVFLRPRDDGSYAILHLLQGAFHVVELEDRDVAFRVFTGATELASKGLPARDPEMPRDLARFRGWLADRADGIERAADYFIEIPAAGEGSADKFNLIRFGGIPARWRNFDLGNPLRWRVHQAGQPGLPGGGFSEFSAAVNAWNADPGSNIDLRNAGTTTSTAGGGPPDDQNVLLFDDPNGDFDSPFSCGSGGTIASAFVRSSSSQHIHNNMGFRTLREADIITNKGIQCWIASNNRAAEVFAHELGHGLGIDHSCGDDETGPCDTSVKNQALMRAQAHGDGRGASLREDDRAAIAFLYGVSAPASPDNLTATAIGSDLVRLAWTDRSNDEDSFEIQRRAGGGSFQTRATIGANRQQFDDGSVVAGVTYTYRVRARNGGGPSAFSNTASATTAGERAPTGLIASAISATEIVVDWQDNALTETGYEVQGSAAGGPFVVLRTVPADSETATLSGLLTGTTYRLRVRATGGAGNSGFSGEALATTFCVAGLDTLCLNGGRFKVEVDWLNFEDETGVGSVVPGTSDDSGLLWFFDADNWEMLIKVLNGCDFNDRFWVFAAATTNVEYTMTVTDTAASVTRTYANELGVSSPAVTDTDAFATCAAGAPAVSPPVKAGPAPPAAGSGARTAAKNVACTAGENTLCLNGGRFRVEVAWRDFEDGTGPGSVVPLPSDDSGLLWFFEAENWEMLIKVLDGCGTNGHFWVFSAATTNVEYTLTVTDTQTGDMKEYFNPLETSADAVTDIEAFPNCP